MSTIEDPVRALVEQLVADACRPIVDRLADEIAAAVRPYVDALLAVPLDVPRLASPTAPMPTVLEESTETPADEERTAEDAPIASHDDAHPSPAAASRAVVATAHEDDGDGGEVDRPRVPSRPACSKCGQSGHNARSCGRAPKGQPHAKLEAPPAPALSDEIDELDDDEPRSAPTTFAAPKRDRFAEIEAAARRRREGTG